MNLQTSLRILISTLLCAAAMGMWGRSVHAQVEGVFVIADEAAEEKEEEKKEEEVGVEEAAQQQAINLGFIVPEENFDQWIFNQNGVVDKGGANTKKRLYALAESRIEEITRKCSLSEAQQKKLELAARGDVVGLFDRVETVRFKFRQIRNDQNKFNQIWQDIQPLQVAMTSEQFGQGSFFHKCMAKVLTAEQMQQYEEGEKERRRYHYRAAISAVVAQMEVSVPMLAKQRDDLIDLTLEETPLPKRFGQYTQQVVYAQMASLPSDKLKQIFDPVQYRIIDQHLAQVRGMKRWLIQQGILEAEPPRKTRDVDD
jgi:hypothetical protein